MNKVGLEIVAAALSAFLLAVQPALGGPDKTTQYLMDNPPSLLDFGINRLEDHIRISFHISRGEPGAFRKLYNSVLYDFENDNIIISGMTINPTENDIENSEGICRRYINYLREMAGVSSTTGELVQFREWTMFAAMFAHAGYTNDTIKPSRPSGRRRS